MYHIPLATIKLICIKARPAKTALVDVHADVRASSEHGVNAQFVSDWNDIWEPPQGHNWTICSRDVKSRETANFLRGILSQSSG
jgi:hypothetical protein